MAGEIFGARFDRHVDAVSMGEKKSGVAQVLSMMTQAPRACATSAIAGTSWISNVCEPGDSVKHRPGVRPHQRFDSGADAWGRSRSVSIPMRFSALSAKAREGL